MADNKELSGKAAIVTGGGSGIGWAVVQGLAEEGASVTIADLKLEGIKDSVQSLEKLGGRFLTVQTDVTNWQQVKSMVDRTVAEFGTVDILVNCAGIAGGANVVDLAEETWDRVLATNLKGVFLCCKAVLPVMIERRQGKIVSISSSSSVRPVPGGSAYAASKAGVNAFTRALAYEVGQYGINVNAVAPGITDTPMVRATRSEADLLAVARSGPYGLANPMGRVAQPKNIADVVVFLVKEASRHITAQTIHVNAGSTTT